jgi:hypothetical protein
MGGWLRADNGRIGIGFGAEDSPRIAAEILRPQTLAGWLGVTIEIDFVVAFADPLAVGTRRVIPFEA